VVLFVGFDGVSLKEGVLCECECPERKMGEMERRRLGDMVLKPRDPYGSKAKHNAP